MAKFRKKPVVIDAVQWDGNKVGNGEPAPDWITDAINLGPKDGGMMRIGNTVDIFTLEGVMVARPGDWIIRGVKGELYPCKPEIFEATYDPAD